MWIVLCECLIVCLIDFWKPYYLFCYFGCKVAWKVDKKINWENVYLFDSGILCLSTGALSFLYDIYVYNPYSEVPTVHCNLHGCRNEVKYKSWRLCSIIQIDGQWNTWWRLCAFRWFLNQALQWNLDCIMVETDSPKIIKAFNGDEFYPLTANILWVLILSKHMAKD